MSFNILRDIFVEEGTIGAENRGRSFDIEEFDSVDSDTREENIDIEFGFEDWKIEVESSLLVCSFPT